MVPRLDVNVGTVGVFIRPPNDPYILLHYMDLRAALYMTPKTAMTGQLFGRGAPQDM